MKGLRRQPVAYMFVLAWAVSIRPVARAQQCVTTAPPADAVVLFNGKDCNGWARTDGRAAEWEVEGGEMVARDYNVRTRQEFGDCRLHVEFLVPPKRTPDEKGNGNSGVYLHGIYEIQIIDSAGTSPHKGESCGAIYGQHAPKEDTALPAGQWQSMDVYFHAPRVDVGGKIAAAARLTVYLNGGRIHDDVKAEPTPGGLPSDRVKNVGPLLLQYHGYPVRFRNLWVRPLKEFHQPRPSKTIKLNLPDGVDVELVYVPAGEFMMGTVEGEPDRGIDEKLHKVTLTRDFWLGRFELTNRQFRVFRPQHVSRGFDQYEQGDFNGDDQPVVAVALADAEAFCRWASEKTGRRVRLPTEAEWEYACRAGSQGRYCFGDDPALLGDYAWYKGNSGGVTHPVGQKKPSSWGFHDMHGNVAEWCADWYGYFPGGPQTDPVGAAAGSDHVWHECSWSSKPFECRCAQRDRSRPEYKSAALGFRIACDP